LNRLCLDTSAYGEFKRGHRPVVELISQARWIGVPAVVLGELRYGFLRGHRSDENERELNEFLDHPVVKTLSVDEEASQRYAEIFSVLRRAGTPIPTNDVWIAALAVREGVPILTYDAHFERVHRTGVVLLRRTEDR